MAWVWVLEARAGWGIINQTGDLIVPEKEISPVPQERPKAFSDGLPLVDSSPEALQWGVLAPERVRPDKELGEKLRLACRAVPA